MVVGVVLATALVPTIGHRFLAQFARDFMAHRGGRVYLIISTFSKEPTTFEERQVAFQDLFRVIPLHHQDDAAPQHPKTEEEWDYWKKVVTDRVGEKVDYFFASEPYGQKMADLVGAEFVPVDMPREIYPVKGSDVRKNLLRFGHSSYLLVEQKFRKKLQSDWVFFGAESVGKTTTARTLSRALSGKFFPEWARLYLEAVGPELSLKKMENIVDGQSALQQQTPDSLFRFFDTDLLSTLGYYRLKGWEPPLRLINAVRDLPSRPTHYLVLDTDLHFTPDQLRYGGDKRESGTKFWIDILEEFGKPYTVIRGAHRVRDCIQLIESAKAGRLGCTYKELIDYRRD